MWLGEKITDKGIGNGISILIMVGILFKTYHLLLSKNIPHKLVNGGLGSIMILIEVLFWLVVILLAIVISVAVRKIPIQYVSRAHATGGVNRNLLQGARQWIPLKVNASGVMPLIFAQALMFVPGLLTKFDDTNTFLAGFKNPFSWQYNVLLVFINHYLLLFLYSHYHSGKSNGR